MPRAEESAEWVSVSAFARLFGINRSTVHKWLDAGLLETFRVPPSIVRVRNLRPDEHQPGRPYAPPSLPVVARQPEPVVFNTRQRRSAPLIQSGGRAVPSVSGVYFIRSGVGVKIGCAQDLQQRLQGLQIGSFQSLCVVGYIRTADRMAAQRLEHALHRQFHAERVRGEWFRLTAEIVGVMQAQGFCDHAALMVNVRQGDQVSARA